MAKNKAIEAYNARQKEVMDRELARMKQEVKEGKRPANVPPPKVGKRTPKKGK